MSAKGTGWYLKASEKKIKCVFKDPDDGHCRSQYVGVDFECGYDGTDETMPDLCPYKDIENAEVIKEARKWNSKENAKQTARSKAR